MSIPATLRVLGVILALAIMATVSLLCDISVEFLTHYTATGESSAIASYPGLIVNSFGFMGSVGAVVVQDRGWAAGVAVEGQPDSIVLDIENMVPSYVEKPNSIILAISYANQDIATSDASKLTEFEEDHSRATYYSAQRNLHSNGY